MDFFIAVLENFSKYNLRALFFPCWPQDFLFTARHKVSGELHRLDLSALRPAHQDDEDPGFPVLGQRVVVGGVRYKNRRPIFLHSLCDEDYVKLFHTLRLLGPEARFPPWPRIMKTDSQYMAPVFHSIMKHIYQWVNTTRKIPGANAPEIISFTWSQLARDEILSVRNGHVYPIQATNRASIPLSTECLLRELWNYISTYSRELLSDDFNPWLSTMLPTPLTTDSSQTAAYEYMRRFFSPQWYSILSTTPRYIGPVFSQLTFMREYNTEAKIVEARLPWTIWGNVRVRQLPPQPRAHAPAYDPHHRSPRRPESRGSGYGCSLRTLALEERLARPYKHPHYCGYSKEPQWKHFA
ncbi:uncharacterized protein BDV14DRAFT_34454 [Aspergillus stella-maris]|uniref:uncharacterized protein n=1 Tax=Aspergillus stella-maris TaxID=1810926 RepID=UPI003CCDAE6D